MTRKHPAGPEVPGGVFVGRKPELAELTAALEEALAGRGRLVLLVGEPGIGKTRLAGEIADHAASRGAPAAWGRCWEGDGAPAYCPWVQILPALIREREPQRVRAEMGPGEAAIGQLATAFGLGGRARKAGDVADRARKAVTSRILETIARITTEHPALGRHLENAIRTGVFCAYLPDRSPDWNC
jgi:hypothetical protein